MNREEYIQIIREKRASIEKMFIIKLPKTKSGFIICENLVTLFLCRAIDKVDYCPIETREEAIAILVRQAKDVMYDYYRAMAKKTTNIIGTDIGGLQINDPSQMILETIEQNDIRKKLIDQLSDSELEFFNIAIIQKQPYAVVARIFNISVVAVKKRVSRLRLKMKQIYSQIKDV